VKLNCSSLTTAQKRIIDNIPSILNKILVNQLNPSSVMTKLDELTTEASKLLTYGSPLNGELLPGSEPDPVLPCNAPPNAFKVYVGGAVAWKSSLPLRAIQVGAKDYVDIVSLGNGIAINAFVSARPEGNIPEGKMVIGIKNNEFLANPNNTVQRKISEDRTTLEVINDYGDVALKVKFLNPHAIRVTGEFFNGSRSISVTPDEIRVDPAQIVITGSPCSGEVGRAAFSF